MLIINVEWLEESKVFLATSDDVKGLVLEADTLDDLVRDLKEIVPILIEENGIEKQVSPSLEELSINVSNIPFAQFVSNTIMQVA